MVSSNQVAAILALCYAVSAASTCATECFSYQNQVQHCVRQLGLDKPIVEAASCLCQLASFSSDIANCFSCYASFNQSKEATTMRPYLHICSIDSSGDSSSSSSSSSSSGASSSSSSYSPAGQLDEDSSHVFNDLDDHNEIETSEPLMRVSTLTTSLGNLKSRKITSTFTQHRPTLTKVHSFGLSLGSTGLSSSRKTNLLFSTRTEASQHFTPQSRLATGSSVRQGFLSASRRVVTKAAVPKTRVASINSAKVPTTIGKWPTELRSIRDGPISPGVTIAMVIANTTVPAPTTTGRWRTDLRSTGDGPNSPGATCATVSESRMTANTTVPVPTITGGRPTELRSKGDGPSPTTSAFPRGPATSIMAPFISEASNRPVYGTLIFIALGFALIINYTY